MKLTSRIAIATTLTCAILGIGAILVHVNSVINILNMQNKDRGISMAHALVAKIESDPKIPLNKIINEYANTYLYPQIKLFDKNGELLFANQGSVLRKNIPTFFDAIFIRSKIANVNVSSVYWKSLSNVEIIFNKEAISAMVWKSSKIFIYYYIVFLMVVLFVQYVIMNNFRELVKAARMLNQRNYKIKQMFSSAPDLKEFANLINYVPYKINKINQGHAALNHLLRKKIVLNNRTYLHNRSFFESQLHHLLHSSRASHGGYLIYFIVNHEKIAHSQISKELDNLGQRFNVFSSAHFEDDVFALVVLKINEDILEKILIALQNDLYAKNIGVVRFSKDSYKDEICNRACAALKQAEISQGICIDENDLGITNSINDWQKFISKTINHKSILLTYQPVYLYGQDISCLHYEVIMQMMSDKSVLLGMSNFLPHVEHLNLTFDLLKIEVERVLEHVAENFHAQHNYAIKLSESIVTESKLFIKYLEDLISSYKFPSLIKKITFEIAESTIRRHYNQSLEISQFLKRNKIVLGIEHFGIHHGYFEQMHDLHIKYLKIDGSYSKNIDNNYDHQLMVKSFVELAHSYDILVIATHVDTQMERDTLLDLKVDGMHGLYMGLGII